jgi:hypothetical protein
MKKWEKGFVKAVVLRGHRKARVRKKNAHRAKRIIEWVYANQK